MSGDRPRRLFVAAGVLAVLAAGCHREDGDRAQRFVASGDRYATHGEWKAATLEYRNALAISDAVSIHRKLAEAYEQLHAGDKALAEYARVLELDRGDSAAARRVGSAFIADGRYADAERVARAALTSHTAEAGLRALLARALDRQGRHVEARKEIEAAMAADVNDIDALLAQAEIDLAGGRGEAARTAALRATEHYPRSPEAWVALGRVAWRLGDRDGADRALSRALTVASDPMPVHRLLAEFYMATGAADRAEAHLRATADQSPLDSLALADFYLQRSRVTDAESRLLRLSTTPGERNSAVAAQAHLRLAAIAESRGDRESARSHAEAAAHDRAAEPAARLAIGRLLAQAGDLTGARREMERAATLAPDSADVQFALGRVAQALDDRAAAERAYRRARDQSSDPSAADGALAELALDDGNAAEALTLADAAHRRHPSAASAALLVRALVAAGQQSRAITVLSAAERQWRDARELRFERAAVELARGHAPVARAIFEDLLRGTPHDVSAQQGMVAARWAEGDREAARQDVDRWRSASPDDARLQVLSAQLDASESHADRAEHTLQQFIGAHPTDVVALRGLAALHMSSHNFAAAVNDYRQLTERRPRDEQAWVALGMLLETTGNRPAARDAYVQALSVGESRSAIAANNLAWLLAADGRLEEAQDMAQRALRAAPNTASVVDTAGWMLHLAGHEADAAALLEKAKALNPRSATYHYHVGAVYAAQGRRGDATTSLQRALSLSGNFEGVSDARTLLSRLSTGHVR